MNKYIDADLLREKIAEQMNSFPREVGRGAGTITSKGYGMMQAFQIMRSIINSLQQEQGLIVINKKDWEAQEQFRKNKDFGKPLQQEQQTLNLDADIEMEWDSFSKHLAKYGEESENVIWLNWNSFKDVARNFYELGLKSK